MSHLKVYAYIEFNSIYAFIYPKFIYLILSNDNKLFHLDVSFGITITFQ